MTHLRPVPFSLALLACVALAAGVAAGQEDSLTRPFAPEGRVRFDLSAGAYSIVAGRSDQILVRWKTTTPEEQASVKVDVRIRQADADITVTGPRNHLDVTIELPARTDLDVRFSAGDLRIRGLAGNKRVEAWAGRIDIEVGRPDDYASVRASVTAGDLVADAFDAKKGGLFRSFSWTGPGRYTLDVRLTAGDLRLR